MRHRTRAILGTLLAATLPLLIAAPAQGATPSEPAPQSTATFTATTSAEATAAGLRLTVDATGAWSVESAPAPDHVGVHYPVSYCSGTFLGPRMLSTYTLEFGGQQTCDNPKDWAHGITVELQSTCSDIWCIIFDPEGEVGSGLRMQRVVSASGGLGCDNTDRRKYRNVADVYARNIYIGAVVGTYEPILRCSM
ncbi:hypothetical protein ABT235_25965 [Micromonospora echinofusca]|uniref:hypothetical protein n=1 Tax=Micromonospora echinofusca TaxID=47858 RepID=UPI00332A9C45